MNPRTNQILCKAHDQTSEQPLRHTSMVCIDLVAKLHGGGAWDLDMDFTHSEEGECKTMQDRHGGLWITGDGSEHAKIGCSEKSLKRKVDCDCSRRTEPKDENVDGISVHGNSSFLKTEGEKILQSEDVKSFGEDTPYLCTGYDLYITREPCAM